MFIQMEIIWRDSFDEESVSHKYLLHTDSYSNKNNYAEPLMKNQYV
jgi:hypothetical protein